MTLRLIEWSRVPDKVRRPGEHEHPNERRIFVALGAEPEQVGRTEFFRRDGRRCPVWEDIADRVPDRYHETRKLAGWVRREDEALDVKVEESTRYAHAVTVVLLGRLAKLWQELEPGFTRKLVEALALATYDVAVARVGKAHLRVAGRVRGVVRDRMRAADGTVVEFEARDADFSGIAGALGCGVWTVDLANLRVMPPTMTEREATERGAYEWGTVAAAARARGRRRPMVQVDGCAEPVEAAGFLPVEWMPAKGTRSFASEPGFVRRFFRHRDCSRAVGAAQLEPWEWRALEDLYCGWTETASRTVARAGGGERTVIEEVDVTPSLKQVAEKWGKERGRPPREVAEAIRRARTRLLRALEEHDVIAKRDRPKPKPRARPEPPDPFMRPR